MRPTRCAVSLDSASSPDWRVRTVFTVKETLLLDFPGAWEKSTAWDIFLLSEVIVNFLRTIVSSIPKVHRWILWELYWYPVIKHIISYFIDMKYRVVKILCIELQRFYKNRLTNIRLHIRNICSGEMTICKSAVVSCVKNIHPCYLHIEHCCTKNMPSPICCYLKQGKLIIYTVLYYLKIVNWWFMQYCIT